HHLRAPGNVAELPHDEAGRDGEGASDEPLVFLGSSAGFSCWQPARGRSDTSASSRPVPAHRRIEVQIYADRTAGFRVIRAVAATGYRRALTWRASGRRYE